MKPSAGSPQALIDELVRSTGAADARAAVRMKAQELIDLCVGAFGDTGKAPEVDVLASLRGIARSDERPIHSPDAELAPDGSGGVVMRVNPDRPEVRQRFSIAHEITHTFFPDYATKTWCRTDARYRDRNDPDDVLEMLCDVGAAELLFPLRWFASNAAAVRNASGLLKLAGDYNASREATLRRYAESSPRCLATVFFSWKLKPTQERTIGRTDQASLFATDQQADARAAWKLRIDYAIPSASFVDAGHYLPKDKSIETEGAFENASRGACAEGTYRLDLGGVSGTFLVHAVPLYTPRDERGPAGEWSIAAVLEPIEVKTPKKKIPTANRSLFD